MNSSEWTLDRKAFAGVAGWSVFCIAAVALRGVRWEETYEHALMITGMVPYPEGHPSFLYARDVFSGQSYLSALLLWITRSELLVTGLRNVLHLAFSVVPVFLLASYLTGKTRWGHMAAAFVLLNCYQVFESYYPIVVWPNMYGIGQIGMGLVVLTLALLAGGKHKAAWFLIGLMVCLHIGQLPVLLLTAGLCWCWAWQLGRKQECRESFLWCMGGLGISVAFWLIQRAFFYVPLPETGAYAATGDWRPIWLGYSKLHDLHRFFTRFNPFSHSLMLMYAALLLGAGASLWQLSKIQSRRPAVMLGVFCLLTCITVWTTKSLAEAWGDDVPFWLIGWMPYRLANHLAPVSLVLALWLISQVAEAAGRKRILVVPYVLLGWSLTMLFTDKIARAIAPPIKALIDRAAPLYASIIADEQAHESLEVFFTETVGMYFALAGAACVAVLWLLKGRNGLRAVWLITCVYALWKLAGFHQFGAAFALFGAALAGGAWVITWRRPAKSEPGAAVAVALAVAAACVTAWLQYAGPAYLHNDDIGFEHLPRTDIQRDITAYLAGRGEEDAMLVAPYWGIEWMSRTGHPIMADYQTAHHMTYMPSLAPGLKKLHEEVFGDPIDAPDEETGQLDQWIEWDVAHWQDLGRRYGFKYVVAPAFRAPNLPVVVERDDDFVALYEIPGV
ncbi:MAG: hypothetical protein GC168_12305 [Candidatus Hydrogenedens sp.]|nr:hypothetical protein [Candidatus Hydrogenedens sp.]